MDRTLMLTTVLAVLNTQTWAANEPTARHVKPVGEEASHAVDRVTPGYAAAGYIDMRLGKMSDTLAALAATSDAGSADWTRIKPALSVLQERERDVLFWYALPDGQYYRTDIDLTDKNLKNREYFPSLLAGKPVVGSLIVGKTSGRASVVVATPVMVKGKVTGALGASLYLDTMSHDMLTLIGPEHVILNVMTPDGTVALSSNAKTILQKTKYPTHLRYAKNDCTIVPWTVTVVDPASTQP